MHHCLADLSLKFNYLSIYLSIIIIISSSIYWMKVWTTNRVAAIIVLMS